MSETQEPRPPQKDKIPFVPGQPLPRLWKTEPEPEEESDDPLDELDKKKGAKNQSVVASTSKSSRESKPAKPKPAKPKPAKKKASEGEKGEKRVLLEETPTFDTIESRQRARLLVGGLMAFCIFIVGWNVWSMLFGGSSNVPIPIEANMPIEAPPIFAGPVASRETEASYMLDRARDYAKRDKPHDAIGMLKKVVAVYKGTRAAGEAQAALDRPKHNLPLFPDGLFVLAQPNPAGASAPTASMPPATSTAGPGSMTAVQSTNPLTVPSAPPQVAMVGPPPGIATTPPATAPPGPSLNPGTVGPAPAPAMPMNSSSANIGPPPDPTNPAARPTSPAPAPASPTGPVAVSPAPTQPPSQPQPPLRPGEATLVMPANKGNATVTPPAGENAVAEHKPAMPGRPAARSLPPGFKAIDVAGVNEAGWPLVIVGERDGGKMVLVPGATFIMGHDGGAPEDGPAHAVRLSTYYIDQHEVTNRQFRTFLEDTHYLGRPAGRWLVDEKFRALPDNAPAVFVNYHDAEAYAIWALKRLPTEAQWELAARSVDGRRYPWGDEPVRWARERKFRQIDPVMIFPEDSSPYGVFDMAGNALEWTRDWYDPRYFQRLRDKTTEDPPGPPSKQKGIQRSVRGGSKDWLVFDRQGVDSDHRAPYLGFRCTLAVEGSEASANIVPHTEKPDTPQPGSTPPAGQAGGAAVPF
jgi:formylglycine-generating enzyme required for sulfatase activity